MVKHLEKLDEIAKKYHATKEQYYKDLWFKNIKRTITDNYIRQIIPINYEEGLIMISYSDN